MSDNSKISWCDASWNSICGCSKVSAGCLNCFAERQAASGRLQQFPQYRGAITNGKWNGRTYFVESALTKPLHWRKPRKIFVCSMSDLFHESVPFVWIEKVMGVINDCPQHTFLVLTKRPHIMTEYFNGLGKRFELSCLPNLHLGVTVENMANSHRLNDLRETPAAYKFVSLEPLLEGFDVDLTGIDYMFVGCESGPNARLCKAHAIKHMIRQAQRQDVKVHVKQIPLNGKCNKHFDEWPEEFQIREI